MARSDPTWGVDMTLCIAAVSRKAPKAHIVTVSDLMLSSESVSLETRMMKVEPVSPKRAWVMMFAGSPTPISSLHLRIKDALQGKDETEAEVRTAVETVYRDELRRKIEGEILSPFGLDRATFLREGRNQLGDQEFSRILFEVQNCNLDVDLILAGFEPNGWPRIFSIANPGVYASHERAGFHGIGSGTMRAMGSLYTTYDAALDRYDLLYRLCEAKFVGESALGVGKRTYGLILSSDLTFETMIPEAVDRIVRPEWERVGTPPIPDGMSDKIKGGIQKTGWATPKQRGSQNA
ncbi:hypothetical protein [Candidatus Binatus sp.]|uniref:hypothetical protein n=1 Tax=Candidatus Binatus sp. TaxID=2811406 RepID=UPI003C8F5237